MLNLRTTADLPVDIAQGTASYVYKKVRLSGSWLPEQFLLDNRVYQGVVGYHVLSVLRIEQSNIAVLVNRGWVPLGKDRAVLPQIKTETSTVSVAGWFTSINEDVFVLGETGYEGTAWPRVIQRIEP